MPRTIVTHSYKGGTGKTLFTMNLSTCLAQKGYRVVVLDMDLSAPSIHSFIPKYLLDDYPKINESLLQDVPIEKTLIDFSPFVNSTGKLWIGVSSNKTEDILRTTRRNANEFNQDASKLFQWISLLKSNPYNADFIIIDTSPGISFSSINCVATADIAYVLFRLLKSDITGTGEMLEGLHSKMGCEIRLVPNQVPENYIKDQKIQSKIRRILSDSLEIESNPDMILDRMLVQEPLITQNEIDKIISNKDGTREIHITNPTDSRFKETILQICNALKGS